MATIPREASIDCAKCKQSHVTFWVGLNRRFWTVRCALCDQVILGKFSTHELGEVAYAINNFPDSEDNGVKAEPTEKKA